MRLNPLRKILFFLAQFFPPKARFYWLGFPSRSLPGAPVIDRQTLYPGAVSAYVGFVSQSDGHIIHPLVQRNDQYEMLRLVKRQRALPSVHRQAKAVVALTYSGQSNYFHWLFENVVRLQYLDESGCRESGGPLIHVDQSRPFQRQTFAVLGIDRARILPAQKYQYVQSAKMVLLPQVKWDEGWQVTWLRKRFLQVIPADVKRRRIYVTRLRATSRRIVNEEPLMEMLRPYGFEFVTLEHLTFIQQVTLFQSAQIIMGPHGAAWANLAFASPELHLFELMPSWGPKIYAQVSQWVGLHYHHVETKAIHPEDKINSDTQVDLSELDSLLRTLI